MQSDDLTSVEAQEVLEALRTVMDPELGVNIVDLGLIHRLQIDAGRVHVAMMLTSPACPLGSYLKDEAEAAVLEYVPWVRAFSLELIGTPMWEPGMMTETARRQLGWVG